MLGVIIQYYTVLYHMILCTIKQYYMKPKLNIIHHNTPFFIYYRIIEIKISGAHLSWLAGN